MSWSRREFLLQCERIPFRLTFEEGGIILGFLLKEMSILYSKGMLKSAVLGRPAKNGHKFLARDEILRLGEDQKWLSRATTVVSDYWRERNLKHAEKEKIEEAA